MSALMRDWIRPLVETELSKSLKTAREDVGPGQGNRVNGGTYSMHFTIPKAIQILDFHSSVLATVSDGSTTILASFDKDAVHEASTIFGRDFSSFIGGVVVIKEFDLVSQFALILSSLLTGPLVLDSSAESSMQLIIRIVKFQVKGSEGSAKFGKPVDILTVRNVSALVREHESPRSNSDMSSSPIRSQEDDMEFRRNIPAPSPFSQNELATQMPNQNPEQKVPQLHTTNLKSNPTKGSDLLAVLSVGTRALKNSAVETSLSHTEAGRKNERAGDSMRQKLMQTQKKIIVQEKEKEISVLKNNEEAQGRATRLARTNIAAGAFQQSVPALVSSDHVLPKTGKLDSQTNQRQPHTNPSYNAATSFVPEKQKYSLPFIDHFQGNNPFQGLKRIPRKFIRIPEIQQKLLDHQDSWFQEHDPNRTPFASIPSKVHNDLTSFMSKNTQSQLEPQTSTGDIKSNLIDDLREKAQDEGSEVGANDSDSIDSDESARDPELPTALRQVSVSAESNTESEDEESMSWSQSPIDTRQISNVVGQSIDLHPPPSSAAITRPEEFEKTTSSVPEQSLSKHFRVPIAIPFSSDPIDEDDMEYTVPYAEGEVVEDIAEIEDAVSTQYQEFPSTAPGNLKLLQVERTPHVDINTTDVLDSLDNVYDEKKRSEILSDYIIPASFDDSKLEEEVSGAGPNGQDHSNTQFHEYKPASQQSREILDLEMTNMDAYEDNEDFLAQSQLISEFNSTSNDTSNMKSGTEDQSGSLDCFGYKEQNETHRMLVRPFFDNHQLESLEPPVPNMVEVPHSPLEKHVTFNQEILKRSFEEITKTPEKIVIKRQRRLKVAAMGNGQDYPVVDTKAMARASRYSFKNELLATEYNEDLDLKSSRHDLASQRGIPNTSPFDVSILSDGSEGTQAKSDFISIPNTQSSPFKAQKPDLTSPSPSKQGSQNPETQGTSSEKDSESDREPEERETDKMRQATDSPQSPCCIGYDAFKAIYPQYSGTERQFTWTLVYLEFLERSNQVQNKAYDDFVRIIASEYTPWCARTAKQNLIPGIKFYEQHVCDPPIFRFHLITPRNLQEHLSSLNPRDISKFRAKFNAGKPEGTTEVSKSLRNGHESRSKSRIPKTSNPSSKKPFFETFSQLQGVPAQATRLQPPLKTSTPTVPSTPRSRKLPWASSSPQATDKHSPLFQGKVSIHSKHHDSIDTQNIPIESPEAPRQNLDSSPILGTLNPSTAQSRQSNMFIQTGSPLRRRTIFEKASSTTPSSISLETLNQQKDDVDNVDKVQGWINNQPVPVPSQKPESRKGSDKSKKPPAVKKATFQAFLETRRSSGGLISMSNSPDPKRRTSFCTKPKEKVYVEPQT